MRRNEKSEDHQLYLSLTELFYSTWSMWPLSLISTPWQWHAVGFPPHEACRFRKSRSVFLLSGQFSNYVMLFMLFIIACLGTMVAMFWSLSLHVCHEKSQSLGLLSLSYPSTYTFCQCVLHIKSYCFFKLNAFKLPRRKFRQV